MKIRSQLLASLIASISLGSSLALAQSKDITADLKGGVVPYVVDQRGVVARSGAGLCWRTGYWTPQMAQETKAAGSEFPVGCDCDKDLMPKARCEPPPPVVAPTPAPAPAPAPVAPVPTPKPAAQKVTLSADALFDYDKAILRAEGKTKLDDLVSQAGKLNLEVIIAVGHADRIGSDGYNQKLSEKRAAAVKEYLVSKGIEANRVYTEGKGEKQPVTADSCKGLGADRGRNKKLVDCLQPDRRVEIEVIGTK